MQIKSTREKVNYLIISFNTGEKNNLTTSMFIDRFPRTRAYKQFAERTKYAEPESLMKSTKKGIYIYIFLKSNI